MKMKYKIITLGVLALLASQANADTFKGYNVNLVNTATVLGNGDLQLTAGSGGHGAAWLTSSLSTANSFTATFSFSLQSVGFNPMADGIAFVLQNNGNNVIGFGGGNIGYNGLNGVGSIVQTWFNNTTGLNTDGNAYNTQAAPTNLGAAALVIGTETVSYNSTTHQMNMTGILNVDGNLYNVSDSANVDLSTQFGSSMFAGFTGSTGLSYADQRITDFSISPIPEPETYAMLLAGLGLLGFMARRRKESAV